MISATSNAGATLPAQPTTPPDAYLSPGATAPLPGTSPEAFSTMIAALKAAAEQLAKLIPVMGGGAPADAENGATQIGGKVTDAAAAAEGGCEKAKGKGKGKGKGHRKGRGKGHKKHDHAQHTTQVAAGRATAAATATTNTAAATTPQTTQVTTTAQAPAASTKPS